MRDLLLYVADADAMAFMRSVLSKPQALGIRPISVSIERHPQRDAGMVQSGAELVCMQKGQYDKGMLIWDHHGSGRDHKQSPIEVKADVQGRLDACSWKARSTISILEPELEQWLWYCPSALAAHCQVTTAQLQQWVEDRAQKLGRAAETLKREQPKELFEHVLRDRLKRTISPRDFEEIGQRAGVSTLLACDSFRVIVETLRLWFPP